MVREGYSYHVFLSFRGPDTRDKFTCLLYEALTNAGLVTFMDDENIHMGEEIHSRIRDGIKGSMSAIIVFSENYAYSKWCLDELLLILEQRERTSVYTLLPIYYDGVEPADVKHQRGKYGEALEKHKKRCGEKKIEEWRTALEKVGGYKGEIVKGKINEFFKKIVEEIRKELGGLVSMVSPPPSVNPQPSGSIQGSYLNSKHGPLPFNVATPYPPPALHQEKPLPQEANNVKKPENEDATNSQNKKESVEEPVKYDRTRSTIKLSRTLDGYPKKCPPGGEEKLVLYISSGDVKSIASDCVKVKKILKDNNLDFEERKESKNPEFRNELQNLLGRVSYPRLFALGREIGGVVEVVMLDQNGQLKNILMYCEKYHGHSGNTDEKDADENDEEDVEAEAEAEQDNHLVLKVTPTTSKNIFRGCRKKCPPGGNNKVVLYTWFTAAVTSTTKNCLVVKKILQDKNVNFEERDAKKYLKFRDELKKLVGVPSYPRLFVKGWDIGEVKTVESMDKTGQLRSILREFQMPQENAKRDLSSTCFIENGATPEENTEMNALSSTLLMEKGLTHQENAKNGLSSTFLLEKDTTHKEKHAISSALLMEKGNNGGERKKRIRHKEMNFAQEYSLLCFLFCVFCFAYVNFSPTHFSFQHYS